MEQLNTRNNRRNIIDETGINSMLMRITIFSAGGPLLDGLMLTNIGIALVLMAPELGLNVVEIGLVGTAALVGIFFGGFIFGAFTDHHGRVLMYKVDLIMLLVLSLLHIFVTEAWQLIAIRFLMGVAIGADYPIVASLLSEFMPKKHHSTMMSLQHIAWNLGTFVAAIIGYTFLTTVGGWKLMLGWIPAVLTLILLLGRWGLPESPRWLLQKGRVEEARAVVKRVWGPEADIEDLEIEEQAPEAKVKRADLFRGGYGKRLFFVCGFWMLQVIPFFGIGIFVPRLMEAFGFVEGNSWIWGNLVVGLFYTLGVIYPMYTLNKFGRRKTILWCFFFIALSLLLLGLIPHPPIIVVLILFIVFAFANGGPSCLSWIYPSELFPTEVRATAVGIGTSFSRIGSAVTTFILPMALASYGIQAIMIAMAIAAALGWLISFLIAPETKGMSLEKASSLSHDKKK